MPTMHDRSEVIFERTISEHKVEGKEETAETAETEETADRSLDKEKKHQKSSRAHTKMWSPFIVSIQS